MSRLKESASQTAGPYVHIGCVPSFAGLGGEDLGSEMLSGAVEGERIDIEGHVFDGDGVALTDAMLEIWQADSVGGFDNPDFPGWGRQPTDGESGLFRFKTIRPGRLEWPGGGLQAPHIAFWIVARGINLGLHTRMYFGDEAGANVEDPVLALVGTRRAGLVAPREGDAYRFDIHLQGENETVFFDV